MAINLMQDQVIEKCRWLANVVGLNKKPDEPKAEVPKIVEPKGKQNKDKNKKDKKKKKKKTKEAEEADPIPDANDEDQARMAAAHAKRRESVDPSSVPEGGRLSPSDISARPVSAMSVLPGMAEE